MRAVLDVVLIVLQLYVYVIIASAILSWLVAFNVVNRYNDFVRSIWNLVTALTEPLLKPIRGVIPNFGGIDIFAGDFAVADFLHSTRHRGIYLSKRLLNLEQGAVEFSRRRSGVVRPPDSQKLPR